MSSARPEDSEPVVGWKLYMPSSADSVDLPKIRVLLAALRRYLSERCVDVEHVLRTQSYSINHYSLVRDVHLLESWPDIAECVVNQPHWVIALLGLAIYELVVNKLPDGFPEDTQCAVPKITARLSHFSPVYNVGHVHAASYGKYVGIRGVVVRVSCAAPHCLSMTFECIACFHAVKQQLNNGEIQAPVRCCHCGCHHLRPLKSRRHAEIVERQIVTLQEVTPDEHCHHGADGDNSSRIFITIECELLADLVDSCVPGDIVIVYGVIQARRKQSFPARKFDAASKRRAHALYIETNFIRTIRSTAAKANSSVLFSQKDYYAIAELQRQPDVFRVLVSSLCPSICGHNMVKAGLLLAMMSGSENECGSSVLKRSTCHVLIVGDPGLGKTQLLKACTAAAPRCVFVCGGSSPTLMVTTGRERRNHQELEAGALVLADGGCCSVDELNKLTSAQCQQLLEVMDEQKVSVARDSVMCCLPARVSVLAATNPTAGHYDRQRCVVDNVRVSASLLSRFDLVFVLVDRPDERLDSLVSSHIMAQQAADTGLSSCLDTTSSTNTSLTGCSNWDSRQPLAERLTAAASYGTEPPMTVPPVLLRKYIAYARKYVHPRLSESACSSLHKFYQRLRLAAAVTNGESSVNLLQLESLVRLTQARARIRLCELATAGDADDVVQLVTYALQSAGQMVSETDDFPLASLKAQRSVRRRPGKVGQLRSFVNLLNLTVQRLNRNTFSEQELRQLVSSGGKMGGDFRKMLEIANHAGVLLKKGHQLYHVQID